MAIAEKCDIDYLLYEGDTYESYEDEDNPEEVVKNLKSMSGNIRENLALKDLRPTQISEKSVPKKVLQKIEQIEPSQEILSLLERRKQEKQPESLLARE